MPVAGRMELQTVAAETQTGTPHAVAAYTRRQPSVAVAASGIERIGFESPFYRYPPDVDGAISDTGAIPPPPPPLLKFAPAIATAGFPVDNP